MEFHNSSDFDYNISISEGDYVPYTERLETYIVPAVFAIIFIAGVVGNGTLVLIMIRHKAMRNTPNTYILSLALGDLLIIVTCVPFTSTLYTIESWPYGESICKLSEATKDVSIGVSVFTLTALSAERYCAIVYPLRRHVSTKSTTVSCAIGIWILSAILALPAAVFSNVKIALLDNNGTIEFCSPFPPEYGEFYQKSVVLFRFVAYYACPLIVITAFYVLMARHLLLSTQSMPGLRTSTRGHTLQVRSRKKIAKVILAFVIIFFVCFLPNHIFSLWFHFNSNAERDYNVYWHYFRILGFCLCFINSCVNPVALYFVSRAFRKYFNRYLLCWCISNASSREGTITGNSGSRRSVRRSIIITSEYIVSHKEKT